VERGLNSKLHRPEILSGMKRVAYFDHIQIAAPEGCEPAAREFYGAILGLQEVEKPLALRARGGCWFQCDKQQVHIGVERGFHPAKKAHPAFVVFSLDEFTSDCVQINRYPEASNIFSISLRSHAQVVIFHRLLRSLRSHSVESPLPPKFCTGRSSRSLTAHSRLSRSSSSHGSMAASVLLVQKLFIEPNLK
jgi:hypothetical protein